MNLNDFANLKNCLDAEDWVNILLNQYHTRNDLALICTACSFLDRNWCSGRMKDEG